MRKLETEFRSDCEAALDERAAGWRQKYRVADLISHVAAVESIAQTAAQTRARWTVTTAALVSITRAERAKAAKIDALAARAEADAARANQT